MYKYILLILIIALSIISCRSNDYNMENRKWYLLEIEGEREIAVINEKKPFIEFDLESLKVSGNATCNNFFTEYFIDGNSIEMGEIATTLMFCADASNQEHRFLQALNRVDSFKMDEGKLSFFEGGRVLLIFISH